MRTVSLLELIDLVASNVDDAGSHVQKLFEWRFERDMSIAKWALGLSASLMIAVLVAFFRGSTQSTTGTTQVTTAELGIALSFALASATYGIYALIQLRRVNREFIAALKLYSQFHSLRELIHRYRTP